MGLLLNQGRRDEAKKTALANAGLLVVGWIILVPLTNARAELNLGVAVHGFLLALIFIGLVYFPRYSFYIIFIGGSLSFFVAGILEFALPVTAMMSTYLACLGMDQFIKRREALVLADEITRADASAYKVIWDRKLEVAGIEAELADLKAAWATVMASADSSREKKQPSTFKTFEDLYQACDLLNTLFSAKLKAVCIAHGGQFYTSDVKSEDRSLQKCYRSYEGDWHRLTDLNRAALGEWRDDQRIPRPFSDTYRSPPTIQIYSPGPSRQGAYFV